MPVENLKIKEKRKSNKIDVYQALMNHDLKQFESEKEHKISKKKQEQQMWAQFLKTQMSIKKERM